MKPDLEWPRGGPILQTDNTQYMHRVRGISQNGRILRKLPPKACKSCKWCNSPLLPCLHCVDGELWEVKDAN